MQFVKLITGQKRTQKERIKRSPGESKAGLTCMSAYRLRFHIVCGHNKPLHPEQIA